MCVNNKGKPPTVLDAGKQVKTTPKKEKWNEIEIITGLINTFTNGFNRIGTFKPVDANETEYIWLLLATRCFNSMWCSYRLMYSGYYSQATMVIRSITEDILICIACPNDKRIRNVVLSGKGELPSYSSMARKNNVPNIYDMYKHQCKFAHTSSLSLGVLLDKGRVKTAPVYNELLFNYCVEAFIKTSVMMVEYLGRVVFYIDKDEAKSFNDDNANNLVRATNWLKAIRNRYGNEVNQEQT